MGVGGDGERGWREGENVNTQTLCSNMNVYICTVYCIYVRDHLKTVSPYLAGRLRNGPHTVRMRIHTIRSAV